MDKGPVLILLGGGRGNWPNFWSVRAYNPSVVYLLRPDGDDTNDLYVKEFLDKALVDYDDILNPLPPFDTEATRRACLGIIERHRNETVLINITQAPAMMKIGACYAARESGPNVHAFHRDTIRGVSYPGAGAPPPEPVTLTATVDDYLAAYGRTAHEKFDYHSLPCAPSELSRLAAGFAHRYGPFVDLIKQLRWYEQNVGGDWLSREIDLQPKRPDPRRDQARHQILFDLANVQMIKDVRTIDKTGGERFRFASTHVWAFLNGTWLELYAYDEAIKYRDKATGQRMFSDCRANMEIPNHNAKNEVDLACLTPAGLLLYASCKTSSSKDPLKSPLSDANLSDVVDRAGLLGGAYCGKMLITTALLKDLKDNFKQQADLRGVEIVCAEQLSDLHVCFDRAMETVRRRGR